MPNISTEAKAAYLVGLYAGLDSKLRAKEKRAFLEELRPHAGVGSLVAFRGGAFNPVQVWEAESMFDRIFEESEPKNGDPS